jgi:hypothetical protein
MSLIGIASWNAKTVLTALITVVFRSLPDLSFQNELDIAR